MYGTGKDFKNVLKRYILIFYNSRFLYKSVYRRNHKTPTFLMLCEEIGIIEIFNQIIMLKIDY